MQVGSVNVIPQSANHMIVSLNGTIQKPNSSFTVSGSTITFSSNLVTNDVIDFIQILGDVLDLGVPSDATVTTAKLADSSVSLAKLTASGTKDATTFLRGDNTFAATSSTISSQMIQVTYDISTANGNLAITGVGFAPETVISYQTVSNTPKWSFGMGTKPDNDYHCTVNNYLNNADNAAEEARLISVYTSANPDRAQANIGSWDSDGITLAWTKTGSPTGTAVLNLMFYK
jgi:hypothetical protein